MRRPVNLEIRTLYHKKLKLIQEEVLTLGSMVEKAMINSMQAITSRDLKLAHKIIADDDRINAKRFEIEDQCIELIATQQPMASDLRIIVAVLNIITEMERIGDYALGNARTAITIGDEPPIKPLVDIPRMSELTVSMFHRCLDSFINRDADAARKISAEDDLVDNLYDQVFRELLLLMAEDPRKVTRATYLMWIAHNLERAADRVTNICERVVFVATGKMEEIGASKY